MRKPSLLVVVKSAAVILLMSALSSCGQSQSSSVSESCDKPGELWTASKGQIAICVGGDGGKKIYFSGEIFDSVQLVGNLALAIPGGDEEISAESLSTFRDSIGLDFSDGNSLDRGLLGKVIANEQRWDSIREALGVVDLSEAKLTDVYRSWCPDFTEEEPYCLPKLMGEIGLDRFFDASENIDNAYDELYPKLKVLDMYLKEKFEIQDVSTAVELYLTTYAEKK